MLGGNVFYVYRVPGGHMVVCVCRNIRTSEYPDPDRLRERIMQPDHQCGRCRCEYLRAGQKEQECCQQLTPQDI